MLSEWVDEKLGRWRYENGSIRAAIWLNASHHVNPVGWTANDSGTAEPQIVAGAATVEEAKAQATEVIERLERECNRP